MNLPCWIIITIPLFLSAMLPIGQASGQLSIGRAREIVQANRSTETEIAGIELTITDLAVNPHANVTNIKSGPSSITAVAHTDVLRYGSYVGSQQIQFVGETPQWYSLFPFRDSALIETAERTRLQGQLDEFLETALDIKSGPQRFTRFLPERLREFGADGSYYTTWGVIKPSHLDIYSDNELLDMVTTQLDMFLLFMWYGFEDLEKFQRLSLKLDSALTSIDPDDPRDQLRASRIIGDQT